MATTLSTYSVRFGADTSSYNKKLDAAQARTKRFNATMSKIGGAVKGLAVAGIAAGAAVTAIGVAMTKKGMGEIDRLSKLSDELGIAVEWLTTYEYAANLTGVANTTIEKGLQRLVRRLGEAKQGHGEAIKGFRELGVSASDLVNLKTEDALAIIADKIKALPNAAEKAATAFSLFGRQGIEMLNFLNLGSDGLATMREEAESMGLIFSREMGAKVEIANDAMFRLTSLSTVLGRVLAIQLAPYITAIAVNMSNAANQSGGFGKTATRAIGWVLKAVAKLADMWSLVKAGWYGLQYAIVKGISVILIPMQELFKKLEKLAKFAGIEWLEDYYAFGTILMDEIVKGAEESAKLAGDAWNDYAKGTASKSAEAWMRKVNREADKQAKIIAEQAKQKAALKKAGDELLKQKERELELNKKLEAARISKLETHQKLLEIQAHFAEKAIPNAGSATQSAASLSGSASSVVAKSQARINFSLQKNRDDLAKKQFQVGLRTAIAAEKLVSDNGRVIEIFGDE